MTEPTSHRRTHKFINRRAQIRMSLEVLLYSFTFLALVAVVLFVPPFVTMFSSYGVDDHQAVAKEIFYLNFSKWPIFLAVALFIGTASVLFSHRVVGPVLRIERALLGLADRDVTVPVKLRKWDFLTELESGYNRAAARLREDLQTLRAHHEQALKAARDQRAADVEKELQAAEVILRQYRV